MKQRILLGLMIVVAIALTACSNSSDTGVTYTPDQQASIDSFAQCLTDAGVSMYGAEWCPHCQAQKALFGDSFQYINYHECTVETQACNDAGIQGYPTWIVDGKQYPGEQSFRALADLTGCEAPTP